MAACKMVTKIIRIQLLVNENFVRAFAKLMESTWVYSFGKCMLVFGVIFSWKNYWGFLRFSPVLMTILFWKFCEEFGASNWQFFLFLCRGTHVKNTAEIPHANLISSPNITPSRCAISFPPIFRVLVSPSIPIRVV